MKKNTFSKTSNETLKNRKSFFKLFKECPIPNDELLSNLGLFINRQKLSRILFMNEMYKKIIDVNGVIMEFGVRWGQNLALFQSFRGMYEPYNHNRKIIGFDTFEGFPSVDVKDGKNEIASIGAYSTTKGYENYLDSVMQFHETESPISHIKKYEIVKGNAITKLSDYLDENPHTIISFAYFDFDIYKPTLECLKLIKSRLSKGAIIGFDELNTKQFPGETTAFDEVFGINKYKVFRSPISSAQSYIIWE
tara:strand:+ start:4217 stop:4966 length:750 start_codon:yes stop_codon:yes gene_type:complete